MRSFVIFSLVAAVSAGRLGYKYQPGVSDGSISGPNYSGLSGPESSRDFRLSTPGAITTGFGSGIPVAVDGGLNKEFYLYSAPEEDFYDDAGSQKIAASIKKNLRVVFIKAPENNGLANAALQLVKQAVSDRTAIYVLNKQPDISEFANQVQALRKTANQKPEVRFIKYRTPEDAVNAQRAIQQQYDALGGSSNISNEGIAPVINFASASQHPGQSLASYSNLGGDGVLDENARRNYLPPIVY